MLPCDYNDFLPVLCTSEKIISLDNDGSAEFKFWAGYVVIYEKMIHLYFQISLHFINLRKVS